MNEQRRCTRPFQDVDAKMKTDLSISVHRKTRVKVDVSPKDKLSQSPDEHLSNMVRRWETEEMLLMLLLRNRAALTA